jgi:hypothetical protein
MATVIQRIQLRRDTAAAWTSGNPTLQAGELGFETDTGKFKLGTGVVTWTSLDYASILPSAVASAITSGDISTSGSFTTTSTVAAAGVTSTGQITSSSASAGVGYATGAGGTVTQLTNKASGVTINTPVGRIVTSNAALAAAAEISFTVTNSSVAATDCIILNLASGGTANTYTLSVHAVASGSFDIMIGNVSASSRSEALTINFAVIKGVTS